MEESLQYVDFVEFLGEETATRSGWDGRKKRQKRVTFLTVDNRDRSVERRTFWLLDLMASRKGKRALKRFRYQYNQPLDHDACLHENKSSVSMEVGVQTEPDTFTEFLRCNKYYY